jgi:hypothetical protein
MKKEKKKKKEKEIENKKEEEKKEEKEIQKPEKKEKVCEIFKVEKNGEKTIKACGIEETKIATKGQIKSENKILKNVLIWLGVFFFIFILIFLAINASMNFEYKGMDWDILKEGEVIFYHTSFPMIDDGKNVNYNVYLRNDPRKLEDIPFDGELNLLEMMVINSSNNVNCDGYGGIAIINLQQIFETFGTTLMKDPNAICDSQNRYMFVKIQEGDVTEIEQIGPTCYNLNVNNCEILEVTEKFIVETLAKYKIIV